MIAAYAFLAAFAVQILAVSVLNPARFIRYVRGWAQAFGSERFAQMYLQADYDLWVERFARRFRAVNTVIAVLGASLLMWFFSAIQKPQWREEVSGLSVGYFLLQLSPIVLFALYAIVQHKLFMQKTHEPKRKAVLQRRGLLDFVSPFEVVGAVLTYFLFVAYSIYLDLYVWLNTSLSKHCYRAIFAVTLVYACNAFVIYTQLYGKKHPLVTHEGRMHAMGITIKGGIYSCIATAWFISITGTLGPAEELQAWRPFALCVFLMITALIGLMNAAAPPRRPATPALGTSTVS